MTIAFEDFVIGEIQFVAHIPSTSGYVLVAMRLTVDSITISLTEQNWFAWVIASQGSLQPGKTRINSRRLTRAEISSVKQRAEINFHLMTFSI